MNIGNGKEISLNEVLRLAAAYLGRQALADYEPTRAGDIRHSLADIELARHLLGYSPQVSFDVGLARTVDARCKCLAIALHESTSTISCGISWCSDW